jgi:hypothetical protein
MNLLNGHAHGVGANRSVHAQDILAHVLELGLRDTRDQRGTDGQSNHDEVFHFPSSEPERRVDDESNLLASLGSIYAAVNRQSGAAGDTLPLPKRGPQAHIACAGLGEVKVKAEWKNGQLVVERKLEGGTKIRDELARGMKCASSHANEPMPVGRRNIMPHRKKPIKQRPKVEDESTGNPREYHGKHGEDDESLPGRGGRKGGLNKASGRGTLGTKQNQGGTPHHERERSQIGRRRSESGEPGGGAGRRDEDLGRSGVYPPTGAEVPEDAEIRTAGEWGQKLGGEVGGRSELNPYELGLTDRELEKASERSEEEEER